MEVFVDILEAVSWPVAIVVITLLLRGKLGNWLNNIAELKISPGGFSMTQQAPNPASKNEQPSVETESGKLQEIPALAWSEDQIREDLKKIDEGEREERLVRQLAWERLASTYDRAYNSIYTSQIKLLEFLLEQQDRRTSEATAKSFYDEARTRNAPHYDSYPFYSWVHYLVSFNLIEKQEDSLVLTDRGQLFLEYMSAKGLTRAPNYF